MSRLKTVYLVGGMENEKNLGAGWRDQITPTLVDMGLTVLNPCEFEPEQLKSKHVNRLPDKMKTYDGKTVKPKHWHHLKLADVNTAEYRRFKKYMRHIIAYDLNVVENEADFLICHWTKGAASGCGTHAEISIAHWLGKDVYMVVEEGVQVPGWAQGCVSDDALFGSFDELFKFLGKRTKAA